MKIKIVLGLIAAVILGGCVGTPDANGWRYGQKNEFMDILAEDRYMSLCDQKVLYDKVRSSGNTTLMTKLLINYTRNLANGCIDQATFNAAQKNRKSRKIETCYGFYTQKVNAHQISGQIKAGMSIAAILQPYVPKTEQFALLKKKYDTLKNQSDVTKEQLHTIRLNIERTKVMYHDLGENYVIINVPEYYVRVKNGYMTTLKFGVIVGKKHLQTPIFAEPLKYIVLNPQWNVPDSIVRNEIIPKLLRNPGYLKRKNMVIRSDYNLASKGVMPSKAQLLKYKGGKGDVPFKIIEKPSNRNALGRIKFIFPNRHSVYMHDTQTKSLFKRKIRTFSHGCVRLEKPHEMLSHMAKNFTNETPESITAKYKSLKTHYVPIKKRVMVHTTYFTAYVDENGKLHLFNDIYGFDKIQKLNFTES